LKNTLAQRRSVLIDSSKDTIGNSMLGRESINGRDSMTGAFSSITGSAITTNIDVGAAVVTEAIMLRDTVDEINASIQNQRPLLQEQLRNVQNTIAVLEYEVKHNKKIKS
jgi:hypothetical protein